MKLYARSTKEYRAQCVTVHRIISVVQYDWGKGEITIKDSSDYPSTTVVNVVPQLDRVVLEEMEAMSCHEGKIINLAFSKKES